MRRIVQFSGGLCSYLAAKRVIRRHGVEGVTLLFADTLIESPGLYRFLSQASGRLGLEVTRIADGRTPWQVFKDERFLGNSKTDPCSRVLKRELCRQWVDFHCCMQPTTIYVGVSWEEGRLEEIAVRWSPYTVEAPMCDPPYLTKRQMMQEAAADGLQLSEAYAEGFPHDNCGGGCVKAGQAHFAHLLKVRPAVFDEWERNEQDVRAVVGDYAILRDRTGGVTTPLPLTELRERVAAGKFASDEWGGCGCGV